MNETLSPTDTAWTDIPGMIPPSDAETWLTQALALGEPLLYLISILGFLIFTALLAIKTKAPGRFLILASPILIFLFWSIHKLLNPLFPVALDSSLLEVVLAKFFVSFALFVGVIGYVRLVWWIYKSNNPTS